MGFGDMFDKLDDIAYEPVKLVCDWLRYPMNSLAAGRERKNKAFAAKLEAYSKEQDLSIEERRKRLDFELSELAKDQNIRRNSEIAEAIKRYQVDLGIAATKIADCVGSMSVDLQERVYKLIDERVNAYVALQERTLDMVEKHILRIEKKFPDNSKAKDIMYDGISTLQSNILRAADNFISGMGNDLSAMTTEIRQIASNAIKTAEKYLTPLAVAGTFTNGAQDALPKENAENAKVISSGNAKLIGGN